MTELGDRPPAEMDFAVKTIKRQRKEEFNTPKRVTRTSRGTIKKSILKLPASRASYLTSKEGGK